MVRKLGLGLVALLAMGCGGGGDSSPTPTFTTLNGELTDGDVFMLDDQRADPYNFLGTNAGPATVRLHTQGLHAFLRVFDTEGNTIAESVANGDLEAHVDFTALNTVLYKVVVIGASAGERGTYTIDYSDNLDYQDQIR
jgi:hypothetical protein